MSKKVKKVAKDVLNPFTGLKLAAKEIGDALMPDMPKPEETPEMPLADEEALARARRRTASARRGGRASTILSSGLGGGGKTLGG